MRRFGRRRDPEAEAARSDPPPRALEWDDYCDRWASVHAGFDPRRAPRPVRTWQRLAFAVARVLARGGINPTTITTIGLVCSLLVPLAVLPGGRWVFLAAGLVIISALADSVDSGVAIISRRTSAMGSYYDAVVDRVSEVAWLVALWLLGAPGALVAACGAVALLHEYARSRAALAGMPGIGAVAVAERPTRVLTVVAAMVIGAVSATISARLAAGVVTVALAVWLVLGLLGATRLVSTIRSALAEESSSGDSSGDQGQDQQNGSGER